MVVDSLIGGVGDRVGGYHGVRCRPHGDVIRMGKREKSRKKTPPRPQTGPLDIVLTVVAALVIVGLRTVAAPCAHTDGSVAGCTTAGHVLFGLGFAAVALAAMRLMAADLATKRSFDLLLLIVGVLVVFLPGNTLALCADASMRCRVVMLPFARIVGVALAVAAVACEATVDHEIPTGRRRRR